MPVPSAQQLASYTFVQKHPITHAWAGSETRRALLAEEHQLDVDMVTDLEFARLRRDRFAPDQQLEMLAGRHDIGGRVIYSLQNRH